MKQLLYFYATLLSLLFIACSSPQDDNEQAATYLSVTPTEITFDANGNNIITIDTDGKWEAITTSKLALSATSGEAGITHVSILSMTATSSQTIIVRNPGNTALVKTVTVNPSEGEGNDNNGDYPTPTPPSTATTFYYENFDGDPSYADWANNSTSWQNPTGEGADNVTYESSYAKIKNDGYGSANRYSGASGKCYMNIYKPTGSPTYIEILNIATNGEKNFSLSFGAIFKPTQCALYIKGDDSAWKKLDYTASSTYNTWAPAKASFTIVGSVEKLSFRFEPTGTDITYGCNIDDLRLETSAGGQPIDFGTKTNYRWAELPEKSNSKTEYVYHTHWSKSVRTDKQVRNYSYCYDVRRHSPIWIAHAQHAIYEEGGKTRPATDPWTCDPCLTNEQSAIIYPVNGYTCSLRTYFDDTYTDHYQWGRGHMLPSSYRGCGDRNNPAEINVQTFYSSNVAAQRSGDCAFQKLWGAAEQKIQDNYICADTLYVVSGAHFANEQTTATDGNMYYLSSICKTCVVPTHFYKIVLRTKSGSTGKAIQDCSANELKAVGFWFSNTDTDEQTGSATPTLSKEHMRSVAEIEELTGNEFDFFPDIPNEVKHSFNPSEWGF